MTPRLTRAEEAAIAAAARIVDTEPKRYPHLTRAVNALQRERADGISEERFHERLIELSRTSRPSDALRRSGWSTHELMHTMSVGDVQDIRNAGWHAWAVWYLTCESFGVEPPWATQMMRFDLFREQVELERSRMTECGETPR